MKKLLLTILFILVYVSLTAQSKPYVLLVSFDGFRWDYLNRGITPNLEKIKTEGVSALSFRPSFPSKTFPNHQSIITGMYPAHHGIFANYFFDPFSNEIYRLGDTAAVTNPRWYLGEAFWETAERQGITTASYFWPGSELKLNYRRPTYFETYTHQRPYIERVEGVINWLKLPQEKRPRFITLYFHETDDKGHKFGPNSKECNEAIKLLDELAGMLMHKLDEIKMKDSVNVIFLSDHGMTEVSPERVINVEKILEGYNCEFLDESSLMTIEPPKDKLKEVYDILKKNENHYKVYFRHQVPEHFHFQNNPLIPTIVVIPEIGWNVLTNKGMKRFSGDHSVGNHGFDNHHLDMHGIFLAAGPSFKKSYKTGTLWNVDIYPLLCKIFGVMPRANIDGKLERIEFILK
ncbi:MAG: phosphodiesterase I [Ignavibacteria bacterium]|nr:MAG: phosphodiesterase I [Ignavibacteria bacterium]KAF0159589.1 MAG: phosphodiesterase I [Ignavibacteria bacterium]